MNNYADGNRFFRIGTRLFPYSTHRTVDLKVKIICVSITYGIRSRLCMGVHDVLMGIYMPLHEITYFLKDIIKSYSISRFN